MSPILHHLLPDTCRSPGCRAMMKDRNEGQTQEHWALGCSPGLRLTLWVNSSVSVSEPPKSIIWTRGLSAHLWVGSLWEAPSPAGMPGPKAQGVQLSSSLLLLNLSEPPVFLNSKMGVTGISCNPRQSAYK